MGRTATRGKGLRAHSKSTVSKVGRVPRATRSATTRMGMGRAASMPKVGPRNSGANSAPYADYYISM